MRVEVSKLDDVVEDVSALSAVLGTDSEVDARVDAIADLTAIKQELRRLARAVRSLSRAAE